MESYKLESTAYFISSVPALHTRGNPPHFIYSFRLLLSGGNSLKVQNSLKEKLIIFSEIVLPPKCVASSPESSLALDPVRNMLTSEVDLSELTTSSKSFTF